jgi:DNA uptake protein ComE-like DNA-binding protein
MWETIRGYLTFTRKERYGVLFLLLIISLFFILPHFFKPVPGNRDAELYAKWKEDIRKFESFKSDSSSEPFNRDRYSHQKVFPLTGNPMRKESNAEIKMFYFDPNKMPAAGWQRLGVPDRLAQTIQHYLEKGGRFYKAEDLKKLYGLRGTDYERLLPFVRIEKGSSPQKKVRGYNNPSVIQDSAEKKTDSFFHAAGMNSDRRYNHIAKYMVETDVNQSDSSDWCRFPGIGEKLASRIIHFREKLGGFCQIEQVAETFGLPDSTFRKIKPYLRIHSTSVQQIDINIATKEMLAAHPYIRWKIAQGIIEYRLQHGYFQSVEGLLQLAQINPVNFEKLKPYLMAGHP